MYVFSDPSSHTAFHARKMKLFAVKDDLFRGKSDSADRPCFFVHVLYILFVFVFYLELA